MYDLYLYIGKARFTEYRHSHVDNYDGYEISNMNSNNSDINSSNNNKNVFIAENMTTFEFQMT